VIGKGLIFRCASLLLIHVFLWSLLPFGSSLHTSLLPRSILTGPQPDGIHTIADALALISHPQAVQMSHPSRPGIVGDASPQILIDAFSHSHPIR
jgi:hypothetical protein